MQTSFLDRYGRWAVVAGAAEGIGASFSRELAARGLGVLALDRDADGAERLARELRAAGGEARAVTIDLAHRDVATEVEAAIEGLDVGLLVYNAATSFVGSFLDQTLSDKLEALDVNARGALILTDVLARRLAPRGRGGILLMSSMAGRQGTPWVATYAATKAFDLVLAESLWGELGPRGVDVLACCAGATRTPGFARSAPARPVATMEPDAVARGALDALGRGAPTWIPGVVNQLGSAALGRILPRSIAVRLMRRQMGQMYRIDP